MENDELIGLLHLNKPAREVTITLTEPFPEHLRVAFPEAPGGYLDFRNPDRDTITIESGTADRPETWFKAGTVFHLTAVGRGQVSIGAK